MRAIRCLLSALAFTVVVVADRPCPAMTKPQLTGAGWNATFTSRLVVRNLFNGGDTTSGSAVFRNNGRFAITENDHGTTRTYTGRYALTNYGSTLNASLDAAGKSAIKRTVVDWMIAAARDDGSTLTNLRVTLGNVVVKPTSVPRTAASGTAFTVRHTASGSVSARLGGKHRSTTFTLNGSSRLVRR